MSKNNHLGLILAGLGAGAVTGLFGAGGGMVLIPLLSILTSLKERVVFHSSIAIILPICIVSILSDILSGIFLWSAALPYLIGSAAGGLAAALWGNKIPVKWLHRILGALIIGGGIRYLC